MDERRMDHRQHSPRTSSSTNESSPALPELSLDASLLRLHQEEDISASSYSSFARSRTWLDDRAEKANDSPSPLGVPARSSAELIDQGFSGDYRFPPLERQHLGGSRAQTAESERAALPFRPRTSRGPAGRQVSPSRPPSTHSLILDDVEQQQNFRHHGNDNRALALPGSPSSAYPSQASPWTVLFCPMATPPSRTSFIEGNEAEDSILLPLQASLSDQIKTLSAHLGGNVSSRRDGDTRSDMALFLDLRNATALPVDTMARFTSQSWSSTFARFRRHDSLSLAEPLPHLYRETGLPIAAIVRYILTPAKQNVYQESGDGTQDSNPWLKPSFSTTTMPSAISPAVPSHMMTASRSFPGPFRTPERKSPWTYSPPQRAAATHDNTRPHLHTTLASRVSPTSPTCAKCSKLRPLSLAAVHPLSFDDQSSSPLPDYEAAHPTASASGEVASAEDVEGPSWGQPSYRHRHQLSQQPSPRSLHSPTMASSRAASMRSSQTISDFASDQFRDSEESDWDLGPRFWTHLSSLGEMVSRQNVEALQNRKSNRDDEQRLASTSSAASDASVLDFSPLGILVPTGGDAGEVSQPESRALKPQLTTESETSRLLASQQADPGKVGTGLLGRRRAHSSLVPLTGWRAGDSDLRTASVQETACYGLPQMLYIDTQRGGTENSLDSEPNDVITPTVTTFQGRARALSFHPPPTTQSEKRADLTASFHDRRNIWDEAISQLNERICRPSMARPADPEVSPPGRRLSGSAVLTSSSSEASLSASDLEDEVLFDADDEATEPHTSPVSGLFYAHWVEQVDGEIDGELGRRGSAFAL